MLLSFVCVQRSKSCGAWGLWWAGGSGPSEQSWGVAYLCSGSHVAFLVKVTERDKHQVRDDTTSSLPGLS